MQVSPNIHRIEVPLGARQMAMHLLVGRNLWLIDTGIAGTPPALTNYLRSIGRDWSDVAGAIITHPDADHCGGNAELKRLAPGALIVAHRLDADLVSDPDRCLAERYDFSRPYGSPISSAIAHRIRQNLGQGVPVDLRIEGWAQMQADDRRFDILHCPGHSAGHLVIYDRQARAAIITDAVLGNFIPDSDGRPLFAPTYRHLAEYRQTIHRLRALELQAVFPTHFAPIVGCAAVCEFLDRSERFTDRLKLLIRQTLKASSDPLSLSEIVSQIRDKAGQWASPEDPFVSYALCYPVAAHLDDDTAHGKVNIKPSKAGNRYTL